MHLKRYKIPAVDADNSCSSCHGSLHFVDVMYFNEAAHLLLMSYSEQVSQLHIIKNGTDEQDGIGSPGTRLVYLVFVNDEIFTQDGYTDGPFNSGQVRWRAEKEVWLGQHGDGCCTMCFVGPCQY